MYVRRLVSLLTLFILLLISNTSAMASLPAQAKAGTLIPISISTRYLEPDHDVWIRAEVDYQNTESDAQRVFIFGSEETDTSYNGGFLIPKGAARVTVAYCTGDTALIDPVTVRIVDSTGKFVRRAQLIGPIITDQTPELLRAEFEAFPDSYESLRHLWIETERVQSSGALRDRLHADLPTLEKKPVTSELLYALTWGYAKLRVWPKAERYLLTLHKNFPDSRLFLKAYEDLTSIAESERHKLPRPVMLAAIAHLTGNPNHENTFEYGYLLADSAATIRQVDDYTNGQIGQYEDVPMVYFHSASACLSKQDFKRSIKYGFKARQLLVLGDSLPGFFRDRMFGREYRAIWPHLTKILVVSYLGLQRYDDALYVLKDGYSKSRSQPIDAELCALEARVRTIRKEYEQAETLYFKAYLGGLKWTKESIRDLYTKQNKRSGKSQFEVYFSKRLAELKNR
ncbi:MAG: hypothetical protein HGB19_11520 [Chlorobiales bacterium]|nr:hypothetical protein [Chlorobiales bacterium]